MKKYVLIVSGGEGKRLNKNIPKQFLEISGRPLLMHTFDAFGEIDAEFVLVLPEHQVETWRSLCKKHFFNFPHHIRKGGPRRFHSVKSGLEAVPEGTLVAIHDGARPLVSIQTIRDAFEMAERKGNAIPVVPVVESVRVIDGPMSKRLDRSKLRRVQTPQVFHSDIIKKAYRQSYRESFTDDASVLESEGNQIFLSSGNPENIKITTQVDLLTARQILKGRIEGE